jgi:hypothetical protein
MDAKAAALWEEDLAEGGGKMLHKFATKIQNIGSPPIDFFNRGLDGLILFVTRGGSRQMDNKLELWDRCGERGWGGGGGGSAKKGERRGERSEHKRRRLLALCASVGCWRPARASAVGAPRERRLVAPIVCAPCKC